MSNIKITINNEPIENYFKQIDNDFTDLNNAIIAQNELNAFKESQIYTEISKLNDKINSLEQYMEKAILKLQETQLEDHKSFWDSFKNVFGASNTKKKIKHTEVNLNE